MVLPDTRNTNYDPGSQLKSADLNDIQDQIIALNIGKHGVRPLPITPMGEYTNAAFSSGSGWIFATSGGAMAIVPVSGLRAGHRITALSMYSWGNDAGSLITVRLMRCIAAGGGVGEVGNISLANTGGAWVRTEGGVGPFVVNADETFFLIIELSAAGDRCQAPTIYYDLP